MAGKDAAYYSLILVIAACAAVDFYLNFIYPPTPQVEHNPIASWLLSKCGNDCLMVAKGSGTVAALGWLVAMREWKWRLWVAGAVTAFQVGLVAYLLA